MGVTGIILLYQGVFQTGEVTQRGVMDIRAIMSYNPAIGETGSTLLIDLHSHLQSQKATHCQVFRSPARIPHPWWHRLATALWEKYPCNCIEVHLLSDLSSFLSINLSSLWMSQQHRRLQACFPFMSVSFSSLSQMSLQWRVSTFSTFSTFTSPFWIRPSAVWWIVGGLNAAAQSTRMTVVQTNCTD